jgi:catechol 2,3-dioxygenase-like lactoylglutathione lyase family enzyme
MIDHVSIGSLQGEAAVAFYTRCFDTLGYSLQHRDATQTIFGHDGQWVFCIYPAEPGSSLVGQRSHLAFSAPSKAAAQAFFDAATALGAQPLRVPGPRPDINDQYYGAMVKDLDGHTLEVVYWDR